MKSAVIPLTGFKATAAAICFLFALHAGAATFSLNPSIDAFITTGPIGNLSVSNYGGAGALSVAAPGLAKGEFQSLLQFDLSGAKSSFDTTFGAGQWSLQSITLQLSATPPNNAIFNSSAAGQFSITWLVNNSWTEGTGTPAAPGSTGITFSTLPSIRSVGDQNLGTFSFDGGTSGAANYSLTLASGFAADAQGGGVISLDLAAADTGVSALFSSRSVTTSSLRPLLTLTASVPEPGAIPLALLGLSLLLAPGRFQRAGR